MPKKLLLIIVLACAVAGLAYFVCGPLYVPQLSQFEATGELARTEYRLGEEITAEPFLAYSGIRRVTISSARPLLFLDVYTAEDVPVLQVPLVRQDIMQHHTLRPNVPYNEKDQWPEGGFYPEYLQVYAFSLQQPGSYYVVVRADFSLGKDVGAETLHVYSVPIWITITG